MQVVARNQDRLARHRVKADRGGHRVAERGGVCLAQQLHDAEVSGTSLEAVLQHSSNISGRRAAQEVQGLL